MKVYVVYYYFGGDEMVIFGVTEYEEVAIKVIQEQSKLHPTLEFHYEQYPLGEFYAVTNI